MAQPHLHKLSPEEVLNKARSFCAYQERCVEDVVRKLKIWDVDEVEFAEIIQQLEQEKFLSDTRFCELYVTSKVRQKRWGKLKIISELRARNISNEIIEDQITAIDADVYDDNIRTLIENKLRELDKFEILIKKQKLTRYLLSKGYETEIIISLLKQSSL